jgi:hypothetical protein
MDNGTIIKQPALFVNPLAPYGVANAALPASICPQKSRHPTPHK